MLQKSVVSVDMGGTKILASVINSEEGIIARAKKPTDIESGHEAYISVLADIIHTVQKKAGISDKKIKSVALGVPGSVNPETGVIGLAPNLNLQNYNIKKKLEKTIPFKILIENDVNLGALGIKNFGVGKKAKNMLAVFIGTGIGGGLIFNGRLYRGSNYSAGEIGHIIIERNGPLCGCGNHGCFEAVASRTAIVKNIITDINNGKESVLREMVVSGKKIKSKAIASAIDEGDDVVINRISEACETIGVVLAGLANFLNFDMIVLGGGLIEAVHDFMMPKIKSALDDNALKAASKGLKVVASELGDDAAIYGGLALTEEFLGIKV